MLALGQIRGRSLQREAPRPGGPSQDLSDREAQPCQEHNPSFVRTADRARNSPYDPSCRGGPGLGRGLCRLLFAKCPAGTLLFTALLLLTFSCLTPLSSSQIGFHVLPITPTHLPLLSLPHSLSRFHTPTPESVFISLHLRVFTPGFRAQFSFLTGGVGGEHITQNQNKAERTLALVQRWSLSLSLAFLPRDLKSYPGPLSRISRNTSQ